jgi:enoyl-CoA hydratase
MPDTPVLTDRRGDVLLITLNRPEARNAINEALANALAAVCDTLDNDPELRVGVLTGAGAGFSSGMDLKAFLAGEQPWHPTRGFAGITRRPPDKPLIAAVEGFAVAGGLEVALACDLLVAASDARFAVPEVSRALVATGGALLRLPARMPANAAMEMALTGDFVTAEDGHRLGFVNRLCSPGEAVGGALELAARIARNGPLAVAATKRILAAAPSWGDAAWEQQDLVAAPVLGSEDAREGARAFAEKRDPVWRGR